jgi:hypothetical protein
MAVSFRAFGTSCHPERSEGSPSSVPVGAGYDDGMMDDPARLELRFKGMLARIFSDGVVTDDERNELRAAIDSGKLTQEQLNATIDSFLRTSFRHFSADGRFTDTEKSKLKLIVAELALPESRLPEDVRRILAE